MRPRGRVRARLILSVGVLCALVVCLLLLVPLDGTSVNAAKDSSVSAASSKSSKQSGKSATSASVGVNNDAVTPTDAEARAIRERAARRDKLIAEKKKKKQMEKEKAQEIEKQKQAEKQKEREAAERRLQEEKKRQEEKKVKEKQKQAAAERSRKEKEKEESKKSATAKKDKQKKHEPSSKQKNQSEQQNQADARRDGELKKLDEARLKRRQASLERARRRNAAHAKKRIERMKKTKTILARRKAIEDAQRKRRKEAEKPEIIARGKEKVKWFHRQIASRRKKQVKVAGSRMKKPAPPVIDISYDAFMKYVHGTPRPYWLFVVFTALGRDYQCSLCRSLQPHIDELAEIWTEQYEKDQKELEESIKKTGIDPRAKNASDFKTLQAYDAYKRSFMPVFFITVDVSRNREVFNALNMQTAPTIIVMNPTAAASPLYPLKDLLTHLPSKNKFALMKTDVSAVDLNEFLNKATSRSLSLSKTTEPGLKGFIQLLTNAFNLMDPVRFLLLCVGAAMLGLLAILAAFQYAWRMWQRHTERKARAAGVVAREVSPAQLLPLRVYSQYSAELLQTSLGTPSMTRSFTGVAPASSSVKPRSLGLFRGWFIVLACIIYLFGVSGCMYTILRGGGSGLDGRLLNTLRKDGLYGIWRQVSGGDGGGHHDQTAVEGLFMGMMQLILASFIIGLNRFSFTYTTVASDAHLQARAWKDRLMGWLRWLVTGVLVPLIWLILLLLAWRMVSVVYTRKNRGFNYGFCWSHLQPHHFRWFTYYWKKTRMFMPSNIRNMLPTF